MTLFYKALGCFGLLTRWNQMVCRLGWYFQYQAGVCGWCGRAHVAPNRHWRQRGYTDDPRTRVPWKRLP